MRSVVGILLVLIFQTAFGQQLPPSIRWKQMKSAHATWVYPEHLEKYAFKTAAFLDSIYPYNTFLLGDAKDIPIILNPYTSVSNGYVTLLPRKSEWYLQPYYSTYFGNVEWYKLLGIHEYRHVVQMDGLNTGSVKTAKIFAGNLGQLSMLFWAYPLWFFEGDATFAETELTRSGRGHSGLFSMPMKMIANEYGDKNLDYYKIYLGSYKRYYPSHYHLGYYMIDYLYTAFPDAGLWDEIFTETSATAFIPGSFHLWLKRITGLNYRQITDTVMQQFRFPSGDSPNHGDLLPLPSEKIYTSDVYPHMINSHLLLFLQYGFEKTPAVYAFDFRNGKTRKIRSIPAYHFTANERYMAWTEYKPHPRWSHQNYSRIAVYDMWTKKFFYLTRPGKYQLASIDLAEGKPLLAAVRYDLSLVPHLEIWDVEKREKLHDYAYPEFESIRQPDFADDLSRVVFSALKENQGSAVYAQPVHQPVAPERISRMFYGENMNYPKWRNGRLFYQTDAGGNLHIEATDTVPSKGYALNRTRYGMNTFEIKGDSMCYPVYTASGYRLTCEKFTLPKELTETDRDVPVPIPIKIDDFTVRKPVVITSSKPEKFKRLRSYINPHSWLVGLGMQDKEFSLAAMIFVNDILDENSLTAGITARTDKSYTASVSWEYKRFFPILGLRYSYDYYYDYTLPYKNLTLYMRIPLTFPKGMWSRKFEWHGGLTFSSYGSNLYRPYHTSVYYGQWYHTAYRHVGSRKGWSLYAYAAKEPVTNSDEIFLNGKFRLPGPGRNDYWEVRGIYQYNSGMYPFYSSIPPVRGTELIYTSPWQAVHTTYHAPLAYPEWGWKRVFYLKRLRYKLFYDHAWLGTSELSSVGFELIGDWNFLGFKYDIPLGIRVAYLPGWYDINVSGVFFNLSW